MLKRAFTFISGSQPPSLALQQPQQQQQQQEKSTKHVRLHISGLEQALDVLSKSKVLVSDSVNDVFVGPEISGSLFVKILQSIPSNTDLEHQLIAHRAVGSIIVECTHSQRAIQPLSDTRSSSSSNNNNNNNNSVDEDLAPWITSKAITHTIDKFPQIAGSKEDVYLMMIMAHLFNPRCASKLYHDHSNPERQARSYKLKQDRIERCSVILSKLNFSYTRKYITKLLETVPEVDAALVWKVLSRIDIVASKQIPAIIVRYDCGASDG